MSFASFLEERGITNARLTNSGRADRRNKKMAKLEEECFNLTIKGEPPASPNNSETCPVCYEVLGAARDHVSSGDFDTAVCDTIRGNFRPGAVFHMASRCDKEC